jgi:hypothetical protein
MIIAASVQVAEMLAASRRDRAALYPSTLHGLTALIYGLLAMADNKTLPAAIEVMADIAMLPQRAMPLAELTAFRLNLLIRKRLNNGWQAVFAASGAGGMGYQPADRRSARG